MGSSPGIEFALEGNAGQRFLKSSNLYSETSKLSRLSYFGCNFGAVGMEVLDLLDRMDENRPIL
jgi:hypothetical protein